MSRVADGTPTRPLAVSPFSLTSKGAMSTIATVCRSARRIESHRKHAARQRARPRGCGAAPARDSLGALGRAGACGGCCRRPRLLDVAARATHRSVCARRRVDEGARDALAWLVDYRLVGGERRSGWRERQRTPVGSSDAARSTNERRSRELGPRLLCCATASASLRGAGDKMAEPGSAKLLTLLDGHRPRSTSRRGAIAECCGDGRTSAACAARLIDRTGGEAAS